MRLCLWPNSLLYATLSIYHDTEAAAKPYARFVRDFPDLPPTATTIKKEDLPQQATDDLVLPKSGRSIRLPVLSKALAIGKTRSQSSIRAEGHP